LFKSSLKQIINNKDAKTRTREDFFLYSCVKDQSFLFSVVLRPNAGHDLLILEFF